LPFDKFLKVGHLQERVSVSGYEDNDFEDDFDDDLDYDDDDDNDVKD